jgi:acetylornithine deacetylase/succinyl-diaminopimelate desuccinylase-like protein
MSNALDFADRFKRTVDRHRLVETAVALVGVPSRTGEAGAVADLLAEMLENEGFAVERPTGGYEAAPAVVVRYASGRPGPTLQFDGHLDVVHLPFVAPEVDGARITGSGSCDMKGGIAAAIEAMRILRESGALTSGSILLTAHDLHEAPWGDGRQLDRLIREGYVGDGVLLPEPLCDRLPIAGRGQACWKVVIRRDGPPVHEVMRPPGEPNVIAAGAELVRRLPQLIEHSSRLSDPLVGSSSVFVGQIHSGEIYNQYPRECWLEGTRRWLPGTERGDVEREFRALLNNLAAETGTSVQADYRVVRDAFRLDPANRLVQSFQEAQQAVSGRPLPLGAKPFVDDGNSFCANAGIAAITHGPEAGGQHTTNEWVSIDSLVRVAEVYALTAVAYCNGG